MTPKDKLYLFPSCIPVRGYARSIIVDTQRHCFKFIPNVLYHILQEHNGDSIEQIMHLYGEDHREIIEEYIEFLIENNFVFISKNDISFNYQSIKIFDTPNHINNAQLDVGSIIPFNTIDLLSEHNCTVLQIFVKETADIALLLNLLGYVHKSRIASVYLHAKYTVEIEQNLQTLLDQSNKLQQVLLTDAPRTETLRLGPCESCNVYLINSDISGKMQCGTVHPNNFATNRQMMAETLCHSSCWHKKISIDANGFVRPCRFAEQVLGSIGDTPLTALAEQIAALANTIKDQIDVCRHCEFRRICPDCRVFTRNPQSPTAPPSRCTYNPYIARWQGQPGYVPVEQCGEFTVDGFVPDEERIAQVLARC